MSKHAALQKKVVSTAARTRREVVARMQEPAPTPVDSAHLARSAELGHRFADISMSRWRGQAAQGGAEPDGASVHEAAKLGTRGPGGPLPHLDRIQRSFGRHDVSGIAAHTDRSAAAGAQAMGAAAFTQGEHVAFAETPSLFTVAHEAAHAVQQRAGVNVPGDVGQVGDPYERHADAVASAVTQGRSSEVLLDRVPGGGRAPTGARPSVQGRAAVQRTILGPNGENIWSQITQQGLGLKGPNADSLRQKIHTLHGLDQEIRVNDFEHLVSQIESGTHDAHFPQQSSASNPPLHGQQDNDNNNNNNNVESNAKGGKEQANAKPKINNLEIGKLIHGHHDLDKNSIDLHVKSKQGQGGDGLSDHDIFKSAVSSYNLLTQQEAQTGQKNGTVVLHPQGAAIVKKVVDMLGETLGNEQQKVAARQLRMKRKVAEHKAQPNYITKQFNKMIGKAEPKKSDSKLESPVLPEHFAYLDSLRGQNAVSIAPVITSPNPQYRVETPEEFEQDMLQTTPQGDAQYNRYKDVVQDPEEQASPSLSIKLTTEQLGKLIAKLEDQF